MTSAASVVGVLAVAGVAGASGLGLVAAPSASPPGAQSCPGCPMRSAVATDAGAARDRWLWPLTPRPDVVRRFVRPASTYGSGHRGVDLAGRAGQAVRAVAEGTVTHAGRIDGRGTVTVMHPSGVRSTYEPVTAAVPVGQDLAAGDVLGVLEASGTHCGAEACLHLGARRGRFYLDPLALLSPTRVILLPPRS